MASGMPDPSPPAPDGMAVEILLDDFEAEFPHFYNGIEFDLAGWDAARSVVGLVVGPDELGTLSALGYEPRVVARADRGGIDPGYMDYEEILVRLQQIEADHPDIARLVNLNEELGLSLTCEGRVLWALKVSDNVGQAEDEPVFVMDGTHHARELVTPLAVLDTAETLTRRYGGNPDVTSWVDGYEIWLIPAVNPDGLEYVFDVYNMWRKNRKYFPVEDEYGVDNNRNYSFLWGVCGAVSSDPYSDLYIGPAPESEEENQVIEALMAREKPAVYVSYHSYGQEVLYPYICADLAETALYHEVRDAYAAAMSYGMRLASASGESFEDAYNEHGAMAFLTEIGTWFQPDFSEVPGILQRIRPGWRYLMERGLGPSLTGHITCATTGEPLPQATVMVQEVVFLEGERRRPEPLFGGFHRLLQPGPYTVAVSCDGYQAQVHPVTVGAGPTLLDVALQPSTQVAAGLVCNPASGTLPFTSLMTATLHNLNPELVRTVAGRVQVTTADGMVLPAWRSGYTNIPAGGQFDSSWNASLPALATLVGENEFMLFAEDVTAPPFNLPPYPPAGGTAAAPCTVTGSAP